MFLVHICRSERSEHSMQSWKNSGDHPSNLDHARFQDLGFKSSSLNRLGILYRFSLVGGLGLPSKAAVRSGVSKNAETPHRWIIGLSCICRTSSQRASMHRGRLYSPRAFLWLLLFCYFFVIFSITSLYTCKHFTARAKNKWGKVSISRLNSWTDLGSATPSGLTSAQKRVHQPERLVPPNMPEIPGAGSAQAELSTQSWQHRNVSVKVPTVDLVNLSHVDLTDLDRDTKHHPIKTPSSSFTLATCVSPGAAQQSELEPRVVCVGEPSGEGTRHPKVTQWIPVDSRSAPQSWRGKGTCSPVAL